MFKLGEFKKIFIIAIITSAIGFLAGAAILSIYGKVEQMRFGLKSNNNNVPGKDAPLVVPKNSWAQEEAVVNIVEKYSPAVVSVIISKDVPIIEQCAIDPFGNSPFANDPFFKQFFGDFKIPAQCQRGVEKKEVGGGTGFIISSDGLILTNKHVVADVQAEYTVLTNDEKKYQAKVLARDPLKDLAIIKIEAVNLPMVTLGNSDNVKIGQTAIAIGNALGEFRNTISVGVISGLSRTIIASGGGLQEELRNIIQTDAAINQGNSGGPLLNLKGEVIGINTAVASGAQNISFALPINEAKKAISTVKSQGKIIYPYIGIRFVNITEKIQQDNKLRVSAGAWLKPSASDPAVLKNSPAEKAGLKEGDIITEVNGEKVTSKKIVSDLIAQYNVGDTIKLKVLRGSQELLILVILEERKF